MLRRHAPLLAPLALTLVLALGVSFVADRVFEQMEAERFEVRYIPSGSSLRALSPAAQLTVANHYWLLTVQYLGDNAARRARYPRLFALVDLITDLDPRHGYAFQTAGIALSGVERLEESDAILRKGMQRGPNWWSYPFYMAFNDFFYRGDYASAARWAEVAARTPGASPNIAKLALALKVKSGSADDAVRFIEEMRGAARDDVTRQRLEEQRRLAVLQRDFARLDEAVERYREARGRDPARLEDLVSAGIVPELPAEPFGGRYVWRDGAVHSTGNDFRYPPAEPGKLRGRMRPLYEANP